MVDYLDPEIANEGQSCNNWNPGAWTNGPAGEEEFQPEIEAPHINDYAAFKKHKTYGKYFKPYRYQPFPAVMYHQNLGSTTVKTKEEVMELGPEWTKFVPVYYHPLKGKKVIRNQDELEALGPGWAPGIFDTDRKWIAGREMANKSLPVKSETQRLAEVVAQAMGKQQQSGTIDPTAIAAIVAAVMAATSKQEAAPAKVSKQVAETAPAEAALAPDEATERAALIELADKDGVKIDKRWGNDRIKEALGL